jgi:hypothetical protein
MDLRHSGDAQFQSAQSARRYRTAFRCLRGDLSRREPTTQRRAHDRPQQYFDSTPLAILQPRTAIAWQIAPRTVLRTGFGLFSDLLPGSIADLVGANPPYSETFRGGLLGTVGGTAIAPGVPNSSIDATVTANQIFNSGFAQGRLSCASTVSNPNTCLQPVAVTAVPDGKLRAPYFMEWSFGIEHQIGNLINLRAQYVGTRAVDQPYTTEVNGYQVATLRPMTLKSSSKSSLTRW